MQELLKRLERGIPAHTLRQFRINPDKALEQGASCSDDMRRAGEPLKEAGDIICGLTCDTPTFGYLEGAFRWVKKFHQS